MVRRDGVENFEMIATTGSRNTCSIRNRSLWKPAANSPRFIQGRNRSLLRTAGLWRILAAGPA